MVNHAVMLNLILPWWQASGQNIPKDFSIDILKQVAAIGPHIGNFFSLQYSIVLIWQLQNLKSRKILKQKSQNFLA